MMKTRTVAIGHRVACIFGLAILQACSTGPDKPKPVDLGANPALMSIRQAWISKIGPVGFALSPKAIGAAIFVASSDGTVASVDARTGGDIWRTKVAGTIVAGVGSDGRFASVITANNDLVTIDAGREVWRQKLQASSYTAPLVAGGRVFLLTADRTVTAFDAATGQRLWTQTRAGEALILRQAGVLLAVGDTLVVGQAGKLVGMNPQNGTSRWEQTVGTSRGTNDVERLVDLVGQAARDGDVVCTRAFQSNAGCVNAAKGNLLWTKSASGSEGLATDERLLFGVESSGSVLAWRRIDGERAWSSDRLQHRTLSAPAVVGRAVAIGESNGNIHLMAREDGALLARIATDGSAIVGAPVMATDTLVAVTKNGAVYGFKPQ